MRDYSSLKSLHWHGLACLLIDLQVSVQCVLVVINTHSALE